MAATKQRPSALVGIPLGAVVEVLEAGRWVLVRAHERWVRRLDQAGREGPVWEVNAETPARWPAEEKRHDEEG